MTSAPISPRIGGYKGIEIGRLGDWRAPELRYADTKDCGLIKLLLDRPREPFALRLLETGRGMSDGQYRPDNHVWRGLWMTTAGFGHVQTNTQVQWLVQLTRHFRWMGSLLICPKLEREFPNGIDDGKNN